MTAEEDPGAMPEASGAALASGYIPHPASERAEVLQAELAAKPLTRYIDEAVADLEENKEGSGKYVTPAYRFALEKLRKNLSAIKPYREAVEATAKVGKAPARFEIVQTIA